MIFSELVQEYMQTAKLNLRRNTFEKQQSLTVRILSALGDEEITDIRTKTVQAFVNDLCINGKSFTSGEKLARKTIVHHLSFISCCFEYAVEMEYVQNNPCDHVHIPKNFSKRATEKEIYTIEEMKNLLDLIAKQKIPKYTVFFTLAAHLGLRRSELLGLEWSDIDFENNSLTIRRTSQALVGEVYTDEVKTKKSRRTLSLSQDIATMLQRYKIYQQIERKNYIASGKAWTDSDRLFTATDGKPMCSGNPYNFLKKLCKRHGLRFCGIHSFRHFTASVLISEGEDPVRVANFLGHSQTSTTLNIYSHVIDKANVQSCEKICNVLDKKQ